MRVSLQLYAALLLVLSINPLLRFLSRTESCQHQGLGKFQILFLSPLVLSRASYFSPSFSAQASPLLAEQQAFRVTGGAKPVASNY